MIPRIQKLFGKKAFFTKQSVYTLLIVSFLVFVVFDTFARPGGGSSFSSSGSSGGSHSFSSGSGSSSSGDGGENIVLFLKSIPYFLQFVFCLGMSSAAWAILRARYYSDFIFKSKKQELIQLTAAFIEIVKFNAMRDYRPENHFFSRLLRSLFIFSLGFPLAWFASSALGYYWEDVLMYDIFLSLILGTAALSRRQTLVSQESRMSSQKVFTETSAKSIDLKISELQKTDPGFSRTVFLDFASSLYHKWYNLRSMNEEQILAPFYQEMQSLPRAGYYSEIVIGAMYIREVIDFEDITGIVVEFDANYTYFPNNASGKRFAVRERWLFNRKKGLISPEPEKMTSVSCPNCGSPADFTDAGNCLSCNTLITAGEKQWFVKKQAVLSSEKFEAGIGHYAPEVGTNFPTVFHPDFPPSADWTNYGSTHFFPEVLQPVFHTLYTSWSLNRPDKFRHLLTDRLYESQVFWLEAYKREGCVNRLEDITLKNAEGVKYEVDKYYESLTVRLFASCKDYVENRHGKLIGGDKNNYRHFSEYWTFIRRKNAPDKVSADNCPNCGALADRIGQAGECGYCRTKINSGNFSWVLAFITQDEVYKG